MKTCLECINPIKGRTDKKFCSDACRNNFNNRQKSDVTTKMRQINSILKKNHKVLSSMLLNVRDMPNEKIKLSKDRLFELGFNFNYFTNIYTNKKGMTYYYCYEYGYLPIENNYCFLVKRREELAE